MFGLDPELVHVVHTPVELDDVSALAAEPVDGWPTPPVLASVAA